MTGVITLTTDFGLRDPYAGIMKGVISRFAPKAVVIDLCHYVPSYRPAIGGLWVGLSYRWFPIGSVHVAVVDPGVGTDRDIVCIDSDGHQFIVPDNGMAAEIARHLDHWSACRLEIQNLDLTINSPTFHGRDVFAPVAARLWSGELKPNEIGPPVRRLEPSSLPQAEVRDNAVIGEVVFADHFGNLVSNIENPGLAGWHDLSASIAGESVKIVGTYGEAKADETIALFNSFGLLEIARPGGSALSQEGWQPGARVTLLRQSSS